MRLSNVGGSCCSPARPAATFQAHVERRERELREEESDTELSEVPCQELAPVSPGPTV